MGADGSENCSVYFVICDIYGANVLQGRGLGRNDCTWTRIDIENHSFPGEHTVHKTTDIRRSDEDQYCEIVHDSKSDTHFHIS